MIEHPFALLRPYSDQVTVRMLTKADNASDDESIRSALKVEEISTLKQVHGNRTILVDEPTHRTEEADGMLTDLEELTLCIRTADCQSFAIVDTSMDVVGVLHVGWRGLVNDAIPAFFSILSRAYKVAPSEVLVVAGPSLCLQCAEFTNPSEELRGVSPRFFHGRHVDLRGAAEDQLFSLGVKPEHFERYPACSRCENEKHWSYRAEREKVGTEGFRDVLAISLATGD
jgi:polyphenol oxidase